MYQQLQIYMLTINVLYLGLFSKTRKYKHNILILIFFTNYDTLNNSQKTLYLFCHEVDFLDYSTFFELQPNQYFLV